MLEMLDSSRGARKEEAGTGTPDRAVAPGCFPDFTRMPVLEAAELLKFVGRRLVEDLLDLAGESSRDAPDLVGLVSAAPLIPDLVDLLAVDPCSALGGATTARPLEASRAPEVDAEGFRELVASMLADNMHSEQFDRLQRQELVSQMDTYGYLLLPKMLWPLAGVIAWLDLDFQYEIAYVVRRFLLSRVLFHPDDATEPIFLPGTFWALIAQVDLGSLSAHSLEGVPQAWLDDTVRSLRTTALQLALRADWEGDWDRWLVAQSFEIWHTISDKNRLKLKTALPETAEARDLLQSP